MNRAELRELVPNLPQHICAMYALGDQYFAWTWDSISGMRSHQDLSWFNQTYPDVLTESITKLVRDPISGVLVGEGSNIPPFVLSPDASKLVSFIRTYDPASGRVTNAHLIEKWRERLGTESARAILL